MKITSILQAVINACAIGCLFIFLYLNSSFLPQNSAEDFFFVIIFPMAFLDFFILGLAPWKAKIEEKAKSWISFGWAIIWVYWTVLFTPAHMVYAYVLAAAVVLNLTAAIIYDWPKKQNKLN